MSLSLWNPMINQDMGKLDCSDSKGSTDGYSAKTELLIDKFEM